jgi:hypothetical protein
MKIATSLIAIGMFLSSLASAPAQTQEPGKEAKPAPKTETPAPATQGEQPKAGEKEKAEPAEKEKAKEDCSNCADANMKSASPAPKADMSKGMKLKDYTAIADILAGPEKFEGKRVLVKGPAVAVCEKRGCWVNLKSDKDASKALRVKVEDGEIVFPMTVMGKEVEAEGVVEKMVIPVEQLRETLKARAEAKGEKFDPATVKEPRIVWQLKGLGAKFPK